MRKFLIISIAGSTLFLMLIVFSSFKNINEKNGNGNIPVEIALYDTILHQDSLLFPDF